MHFTTDNVHTILFQRLPSLEELIQKLTTAEQTADNQAKCYVPGFL